MAAQHQNTLKAPERVISLLRDLHQRSLAEEEALKAPGGGYERLREVFKTDPVEARKQSAALMQDKFIALEEYKALFVYHLIRATGALNVVEAGTSFGVSTIYLATAVGQNASDAGKRPGEAKVIATEHEPTKAAQARENWRAAGPTVEPWIELREGDILETLKEVPPVDFVLLDIWTPMVLPVIKLIEPRLKPGCIFIADNTISSAEGYQDFFNHINAFGSGYTTLTLPYENGLGMTVYRPTS